MAERTLGSVFFVFQWLGQRFGWRFDMVDYRQFKQELVAPHGPAF